MGSRYMVYWRVYVYANNLYSLPEDESRSYRECTPLVYRRNSDEVHRLLCFANRELSVLLCNAQAELLTVFDVLQELLLEVNMRSLEFNMSLSYFLGSKTSHFVHELINFARSPYDDMISYECNVSYMERPIEIAKQVADGMVEGEAEGDEETQQQKQPPEQQPVKQQPPPQPPLSTTKLMRNFVEFSKCVDEDECVGFSAELEAEDEVPDEIEDLLDMSDTNTESPLVIELHRLLAEHNATGVLRSRQRAGQASSDQVQSSDNTAAAGAASNGLAAAAGGGAAATGTTGGVFDMNTNTVINMNSNSNSNSISSTNNNSNTAGTSSNLLSNDLGLEVAIERSMLDPDIFMPRRGQPLLPTAGYPRNLARPTDPNSGAAAMAAAAASMPRLSSSLRAALRSRSRGSSVTPKRRRTTNRDVDH
ncbi:PREDICTED: uncharacterized protein LOC108614871 [Drosophila arizonae]|uniref:RING-type E3 ubiquitin transferase n=1 Tax=Drosophila arizonae TaxID=7263 RepID=A0ABM1PBJ6_DROAR|nr:PREDICTED: uncharacterized protein LOC108614871 [Drosophila arizonae]